MRADIFTALIRTGNKFRDGLKLGENYALSGAAVASHAVYTLKQFIAGEVENKDIQDIARSLDEPITEVLNNINEMHEYWGLISTELENVCISFCNNRVHLLISLSVQVQYKTEEFQKRVQQVVEEAEEALVRARTTRDVSIFATITLALVSVIVPPVLGLAATAAVTAGVSEQRVVDGAG
jgi:DNA gyrase/topoisomerase IV subunit A